MTKDEAIATAIAAGGMPDPMVFAAAYQRFAALIAEREREICAQIAEEPYEFTSEEASRIAKNIRARSAA